MQTRAQITRVIRRILDAGLCVDRHTNEVNNTELAELAAGMLDSHAWLDDETHEIWELAVDLPQQWGY